MVRSVVIGCGSYLPERVMLNSDLEKMVETSDEWIVERTGIKKRHIAAEGELTSDMAASAAKRALLDAGIGAEEIDLIILATTTPDNTFPSTASRVQNLIGMKGGAGFDIQAVCSGFIFALATADKFIKAGGYKNIMVIGAEALSRIVDWQDRNTCILFGDGAGAVILQAQETEDRGIISTHLHTDGSTRELLYVDGGPGSAEKCGKIRMQGKEVFRHATQKLSSSLLEALEANNLSVSDLDWVIPHQANIRILEAVAKKLSLPREKIITTVAEHANSSAASIPLALDVALKEKRIKKGDLVAFQAIGGGLAWGSCIIKW